MKEGDVVITFNYDIAVERELKRVGLWEISNGYGYEILRSCRASPVRVLKLHGSANWMQCLGGSGFSVGDPLDKRPAIMPQDMVALGYVDLTDPNFVSGGAHRRLVLPTRAKRFERRLFDGLWSQAIQALNEAAEIVVIGYSFPAADERALELLHEMNRTAEVVVGCLNDGARICQLFHSAGLKKVTDIGSFEMWLNRSGDFYSEPSLPTYSLDRHAKISSWLTPR